MTAEQLKSDVRRALGNLVYMDYMGAGLYHPQQVQMAFAERSPSDPLAPVMYLGNPHSAHPMGVRSHNLISEARAAVKKFFGANEYEVVFTASCTAALRWVAESFSFGPDSIFACHSMCHNSVLGIREVAAKSGASFLTFNVPSSIATGMNNRIQEDGHINLIAFPVECNFSGARFPWEQWTKELLQAGSNNIVLVDGAAAAGKVPIVLRDSGVGFFVCSFYKMFGFPTGVGCVLVHKSIADSAAITKTYFGGGTVEYVLPGVLHGQRFRADLASRSEDGTPNFQGIAAVKYGFDVLEALGGVSRIQEDLSMLRNELVAALSAFTHYNGRPVARVHCEVEEAVSFGPTVAFSVMDADGSFVGHSVVEKLAACEGIYLRGGCFCNPGACARLLGITSEDTLRFSSLGHVCWDDQDLFGGKPTGCLRVSLGPYSARQDVERFLLFIKSCFLRASPSRTLVLDSLGCEVEFRRVKQLGVYPIKGCRGFHPAQWTLSRSGLRHDREWLLMDTAGVAVSLKRNPLLVRVTPTIDATRNVMRVESENMPPLFIVLDESVPCPVQTAHRTSRTGSHERAVLRSKAVNDVLFYDREVDVWFSTVLKESVRFTRKPEDGESFTNSGAVLVLSEDSFHAIMEQVPESNRRGIEIECFKPNIVVSSNQQGDRRAFEENWWMLLRLCPDEHCPTGSANLISSGPCHRCQQVNIRKDGTTHSEPLSAIASMCRGVPEFASSGPVLGELFDVQNISSSPKNVDPPPSRPQLPSFGSLGSALAIGGIGVVVAWKTYRSSLGSKTFALTALVASSIAMFRQIYYHENTPSPQIMSRCNEAGICVGMTLAIHPRETASLSAPQCKMDSSLPYPGGLAPPEQRHSPKKKSPRTTAPQSPQVV